MEQGSAPFTVVAEVVDVVNVPRWKFSGFSASNPVLLGPRVGLPPDGQRAHADAGVLDRDDAPVPHVLLYRGEVGFEEGYLPLWASARSEAKQNHRGLRLTSQGEKGSKVCVGRENRTPLHLGSLENLSVGGLLQPIVPDMNGVVTESPEAFRNRRRQGIIDQEVQGMVRGNPRSRTASAAYLKASSMSCT